MWPARLAASACLPDEGAAALICLVKGTKPAALQTALKLVLRSALHVTAEGLSDRPHAAQHNLANTGQSALQIVVCI